METPILKSLNKVEKLLTKHEVVEVPPMGTQALVNLANWRIVFQNGETILFIFLVFPFRLFFWGSNSQISLKVSSIAHSQN